MNISLDPLIQQAKTYFSYPILVALGLYLGIFIVLICIKELITKKLKLFTQNTRTHFDDTIIDAVNEIGLLFYLTVPLYFSSQVLHLSEFAAKLINGLTLIIVLFYTITLSKKILFKIILLLLERDTKRKAPDSEVDLTIYNIIKFVLTALLWTSAGLIILQNLGFSITTLLGGVGIAGIAIAFGLQNILDDVFSFFSIYLDKPFKVGDTIASGTDRGTVKKIGIKSTRLKTLSGEELIMSNKELTSARIYNLKRMKDRRIDFMLNIEYGTPLAKLKKIPVIIEKIVSSHKNIEFNRCALRELGDSSINFDVVYTLNGKDFEEYVTVQNAILLQILQEFKKEKIELAYPTQTVYLRK